MAHGETSLTRPLRDWTPLLALLLAAGGFWLANLTAFEMLMWDEAEYASLGLSLAHGDGYRIGDSPNYIRPPLLPAAVAAALVLFGDQDDWVAKLSTVAFSLALLAAVYFFVLRAAGRWPALTAASAVALCPEIALRGVMLLSETPFAACFVVAVLAFARGFEHDPSWFWVGWTALALAFSTRYTALLFGPILLLTLAFELLHDRPRALAVLRKPAFLLSPLSAALLLAPWYLRQWLGSGDPLSGIRYASNQIPSYSDAQMPWHFYWSALPDAMTWPLLIAGAMGLAHACFHRRRLGVYAAIAAFTLIAWHSQYGYKEVRLITPALPFLALGAGLCPWPTRWRRTAPAALLVVAFAVGYPAIHRQLQSGITLGEPTLLNAMEYIRDQTPPDAVLLTAAFPQVVWYAQRPTRQHPATLEEFLPMLDQVDWVVLTNYERGEPLYLRPALRAADLPAQLSGEIHSFVSGPFLTVVAGPAWVRRTLTEGRPATPAATTPRARYAPRARPSPPGAWQTPRNTRRSTRPRP